MLYHLSLPVPPARSAHPLFFEWVEDPVPFWGKWEIGYPSHPWDWYIYLHEWLIFMINVGVYTIHGSYGWWYWILISLPAPRANGPINHGGLPCAFIAENKNMSHWTISEAQDLWFRCKILSFKWGVLLVQVRCIGVGCPGSQSDTHRFNFFWGWSRVPEKNLHFPSRSVSGTGTRTLPD